MLEKEKGKQKWYVISAQQSGDVGRRLIPSRDD